MKNAFCLSCFLLLCITSKAQYIIPGSVLQPRWVFPIWIEDNHGQRDTIYYGYDTTASEFIGPAFLDDQFGEKLIAEDSVGSIQAYTSLFTFAGVPDSIVKVDIRKSIIGIPFDIVLKNIYMPVILRWDVSTLRSDSLPFPSNPPLPRAQAEINWFYDPNEIQCLSNESVLITDTTQQMATCWYQDSLIIENEFGDTGLTGSYCNIYFRQWSGIIYTSLNDNKVRVISIYPNPSIDGKFIIKNISFQSEFNLYDRKHPVEYILT